MSLDQSVDNKPCHQAALRPGISGPLDGKISGSLHGGSSFSLGNRAYRAIWIMAWYCLASWNPPICFGWRNFLLRLFGARVGKGARVYGSARIWAPANLVLGAGATIGPQVNIYSIGPVSIGENAIISQGAHICTGTHDIDDPHFQLIARGVTIGAKAWIAAEALIGPGVKIGTNAVLGARGVAFKDLAPDTVYVGNPARPIRNRKLG